ncbi:MAG: GAF domain-containing protein, partial [Saprospiraceae bacterium]|nr:GAF domain-containing protein [Saprospiraceae bacterium]
GLNSAYQKGLETGDFLFASYAIFNASSTKFYMGMPLAALKDDLDAYAAALLKIKQYTGLGWLNIPRQAIANLMQDGEAEPRLLGPAYDERIQVEQHLKGKDYSGLCVYYMIRMKLDYFFDETESAVANGELCFKYIESVLATPHVHLMYFYYALSLIRSAETMSGGKKRRALRQARKLLGTIRKFAKSGPANFLSKQYLVEAELARVQNKELEALPLYEKAIAASRENEFLNDEALANELLGRYWVMRGDTGKGKPYLLESRRLFHKWGAIAKANWLDRRYGLKVETPAAQASGDGMVTRSGSHSGSDIDMLSLMKAALAISGEIQIDKLMSQLMHVLVENAGAQHGFFAIEREGRWMVEASNATGEANKQSWSAVPLQGNPYFPETVAQFVIRTKEDLVISNAQQDNRFMNDPIVRKKQLRSILCLPIMHQGRLIGILYADNNLNSGVFTEQRVQFLKLLSGQIAVSLENALQYEHLEQIVADRTAEVMRQRDALEKSLGDLKLAQAKLVESEKMASLGQLTAGLAHEINNPINFVSVGVNNLQQNFEELKTALEAYLALDPAEDNREALKKIADKNLHQLVEETVEDSDEMFRSIQNGIKRTVTIVKSLRNFSRLDEGEYKVVDIHEGLDSTLEILQSQIRKKAEIVREYGELPPIECAAGKINQVFMNIINNALQAIDGTGTITLATRYDKSQSEIRIAISDTGSGMTEEVKRRLFEPFFTTKPVGEGTGLGMSISYGIINDHKGRIEVESEVGKGSTFVIYLPVKQA